MKSRISIDVDYDNQPVIKIEYLESDDVRDKLVKKFMEDFGGSSMWAHFSFSPIIFGHLNTNTPTVANIRPIKPIDLYLELPHIGKAVEELRGPLPETAPNHTN